MTGFFENDDFEQGPESEPEAGSSQLYGFLMCHVLEMQKYIPYMRDRTLQRRDIALLFTLASHVNTKTGRIKISIEHIAEELEVKSSDIRTSLSRLKKVLLIASYSDKKTGEKFYLLNPLVFSVGGRSKRGHLTRMFKNAINE
jgi:hypothetical protein